MNDKTKIKFPVPLLILDVFGTLLLGVGLYGQVADPNPVTPYALALIIVGAALMLPLIVHIIARISASS